MKKIITILLAVAMSVACLFSFAGCGETKETLNVYTNAGFAPYEYINTDGEVVGVDIDIVKQIGEILGYNVVINDIDFDQILVEVEKDTLAIGAAGMTKNDERDEIALSTVPYAVSVQYAIVPVGTFSGDKITVSQLAQLTNKAIGVQEGTTGNFMIEDAINGTEDDEGQHVQGDLEGTGSTIVTYKNAITASGDIGSSLGAVVIDKLPAESIAASSNGALVAIELEAEPEEYVIYCNKNATDLVAKINAILEVMIENGVIDFFTLKNSGGIIAE